MSRPGPAPRTIREEVEGLPVPIVPGTRVTEAEILPPEADEAKIVSPTEVPDTHIRRPGGSAPKAPSTVRAISGRLSATDERARDDARLAARARGDGVAHPRGVRPSGSPRRTCIDAMIRKTDVQPIVKDYGTVYEATLEADFSTPCRDEIVAAYQREVVAHRLVILGGSLGFVLVCLAAAGRLHPRRRGDQGLLHQLAPRDRRRRASGRRAWSSIRWWRDVHELRTCR